MKTKKNIKLLTALFIIATIFSSLSIRYTSIRNENKNGKKDTSISFGFIPHCPIGFSMPVDSIIDLSSNKEYVPGILSDKKLSSNKKVNVEYLKKKMDKDVISANIDPNSSKAFKSGYIVGSRLGFIFKIFGCSLLIIIPLWFWLRMIFTILKGDIFIRKNEKSLFYLGMYFLAIFILYLISKSDFWAKAIPLMSEEGYRITLTSFNFDALTIAVFFFILSKVFTLGREMKEDQEYMV